MDSRQSAAAITRATGNALHRLAAALMARGGAGGGWEASTNAVSAAQSVAAQVLKNPSLRALLPPPALGALQALNAAAAVQSLLPHSPPNATAQHGGSDGGGGDGGGGDGGGEGEHSEGHSESGDLLEGVFTIHDMQGISNPTTNHPSITTDINPATNISPTSNNQY